MRKGERKRFHNNMCFVIKSKLFRIMKSPVYYIGIMAMFVFVYMQCGRYLKINYFADDFHIKPLEEAFVGDSDVMDGYIPMTDEERLDDGLLKLRKDLLEIIGIDESQVEELCINARKMVMRDAIDYLKKECPFVADVSRYFYAGEGKKLGTVTEVNEYIKDALSREDYMDYMGRKYADYLGTIFVFFCLILYPFYFGSDCKKDIYELLHTKPISGRKYILSQALGSIFIALSAVLVITLVFQGIIFWSKDRFDFTVNTMRIWKYTLWCLVPSIVFVSAVFLLLSNVFKSPFPAIPLIFIQILYSNAGVKNVEGSFGYLHRPGAILIRYPELFFETKMVERFYINQIGLLALGALVVILAIVLWEKKRV